MLDAREAGILVGPRACASCRVPAGVAYSELLFVYDDRLQDISPDDFVVLSTGPKAPCAPFVGVGQVKGIEDGKDGWIKQ